VDPTAKEAIQADLGPSEKLLWVGRPRQGVILRWSDAFLIPFSLFWGGFAIVWEVSVIVSGAPFFFTLFGVPFVLIGLYVIFGRFWVDARQRARTVYAVTNERIVIVSGLLARRVKSLNIDTLSDVTLTERSDGAGTITFGTVPPYYEWYASGFGWGHQAVPSFVLHAEARRVFEIIREAQRAARRRD
jgi:hypothetical protein